MALILLYILAALFVILLIFYLGIFSSVAFSKPHESNAKRIPVSVLVYAKNNENELRHLLPILLNQNYHQFELVVINNASTDNTLHLIKEYALMYPNIKVVDVVNNEAFWGSKKYALTLGIKASKHEYLVVIDADKKIHSNNWLVYLTSYFTLNKTVVLGTSFYSKQKGFFNKKFRFGHAMQQLQALSWSKIGKPFSLNTHQIAFKKEDFYNTNGFINHMQKPLFTNEFFINDVASSKNTTICEQGDAMIEVEPLLKKDGILFRKQQLELLNNFKGSIAFKIKAFNFIQVAFFLVALASFIAFDYWYLTFGIMTLRYVLFWFIFAKMAKKLNYNDLIIFFPILDLLYIILQIQLFFANLFSKTKK